MWKSFFEMWGYLLMKFSIMKAHLHWEYMENKISANIKILTGVLHVKDGRERNKYSLLLNKNVLYPFQCLKSSQRPENY